MLIKRRPPQFSGFIENECRHEHALLINLLIVSHILYDHHLMNAFCEASAHAQNKPGVVPHPSWNALALFNYPVLKLKKCDRWVAIQPCICQPRRSQGWSIRDWLGPERPFKGVYSWPACEQFLVILQVCWNCLAGREMFLTV